MPRIAILLSILEGDDGSAGCLEECQRQVDAVASEGKYSFSIYINDSGEPGRQVVWEKASGESPDFYLWIDHDLRLSENALSCMLENSEFLRHRAVVIGSVSGPGKDLVFGGRTKRGRLVEPDPVIPVPCDQFDLDLVLVPASAFASLVNPAGFFRPGLTDYGYGSRLAKAGVHRMVAPGILAQTSRQVKNPSWRDPDITFKEKMVRLTRALFK